MAPAGVNVGAIFVSADHYHSSLSTDSGIRMAAHFG